MMPPPAWATPAVSRPLGLIRGDRGVGLGPARAPLGWHLPYVVGHGLGYCPWSHGSGRGVLLSPLPRLHHATAPRLRRHAAIAGFDRYLAAHPVAMPAPGCRGLRPPGCLHQQGPGGLHAPPRVESLPDSTRARDERDELALGRTTSTQGTTTIGLTIRDDAAPPCHIYGQARLAGDGGFHPITAVASAPANASGDPPSPAHA